MTKMESPLAPICFVFQVSVNALTSECMLSNLAIATSLLQERMYSLMVSLLICWSDAQDGGARISINIQFPHCFVTPFYWIWPFRIWIYRMRIPEIRRKKSCRDDSDLFELILSLIKSIVIILLDNKKKNIRTLGIGNKNHYIFRNILISQT